MSADAPESPLAVTYGPVPYVPEVSLFQAPPDAGLWDASGGEYHSDRPPPFWAFAWPGGQILARYVLDHPDVVAAHRVLDLGAGSGLVGIAAARSGAAGIRAVDTDPDALAAIRRNAAACAAGDRVEAVHADLLGTTARRRGPVDSALAGIDVLLAGDLFYTGTLADRAMPLLRRAQRAGIRVLVGDPGRGYLPAGRFIALVTDDVPARFAVEGMRAVRATVWELRPPRTRGGLS